MCLFNEPRMKDIVLVRRLNSWSWTHLIGMLSPTCYELHSLLFPGAAVVDLGAAAGGWTQVAVSKVATKRKTPGTVVAVDLRPMDPVAGATFIQGDVTTDECLETVRSLLPAARCDLLLSDMAPSATGVRHADQARSLELNHVAFEFATQLLRPGGSFVCKFWTGSDIKEFHEYLKPFFTQVRRVKPKACRSESKEM
mmetsp:Transcript_32539/g.76413  ORF Transcript_32539/g.76413 Transcript_32539/m.76413 type:complete len:197 (+) Transcript_32539:70-660(+)